MMMHTSADSSPGPFPLCNIEELGMGPASRGKANICDDVRMLDNDFMTIVRLVDNSISF